MWNYNFADNELYHHGILGMRWGVRRYQNEDGSLTRAGKRRYSGNEKKVLKRQYNDIEEAAAEATVKSRNYRIKSAEYIKKMDKRADLLTKKNKDVTEDKKINKLHEKAKEADRNAVAEKEKADKLISDGWQKTSEILNKGYSAKITIRSKFATERARRLTGGILQDLESNLGSGAVSLIYGKYIEPVGKISIKKSASPGLSIADKREFASKAITTSYYNRAIDASEYLKNRFQNGGN